MNPIKRFIYKQILDDVMSYKRSQEKPIGEIYCGFFRGMTLGCFCTVNSSFGPGQNVTIDFYKIRMSDIEDMRSGEIKFFGSWFPVDDIVFSNDPPEKKQIIIAKYKNEIKENLQNTKWVKGKNVEIESKYRSSLGLFLGLFR